LGGAESRAAFNVKVPAADWRNIIAFSIGRSAFAFIRVREDVAVLHGARAHPKCLGLTRLGDEWQRASHWGDVMARAKPCFASARLWRGGEQLARGDGDSFLRCCRQHHIAPLDDGF
jgi:hypothetical protein